ncbi:MAG: HupE/UreJ family protein [Alphaproteobacteria bacterium]
MIARLVLALSLIIGLAAPALADEFKPAYFRVQQTGAETYVLLWRVPALDERTPLRVHPILPPGARQLGTRAGSFASGAATIRWTARVPGGIEGKPIEFTNLSRTRIDVLARYVRADGTEQVARILPVRPRFTPAASPGPFEVAATYTRIGIEHILLGFDHLLFVLALVMIVRGWRRLVATITAFTLAHSLSLGLASFQVVRIAGPPVEALIALSIVFLASELVRVLMGQDCLAVRKPWIVAFAFGLLHGLGFAGALAEIGLPQNAIPLALLFFNVGVEIGQLIFVGAVLALAWAARTVQRDDRFQRPALVALAYGIGITASFWTLERVAAFWT